MNYLKQKVSFFDSVRSVKPKVETLHDLIIGCRFKAQVERLRSIADPSLRKRSKLKLPCFTPLGIFSTRDARHLVEPSRLVAIDLDAKDNSHVDPVLWQNLSAALSPKSHPNVLYCGRSCSGGGWWMLLPVEQPSSHKDYFEAICNDLEAMGLVADRSGADICRARFVSYDPKPYVNEHATPYHLVIPQDAGRDEKGAGLVEDDSDAWAGIRLAQYMQIVDSQKLDVLSSYDDWRNAAFGLLGTFTPEHARRLFKRLSAHYPDYSEEACDAQFDKCLASQRRGGRGVGQQISIATLMKLLREKCGAFMDFHNISDNGNN